MSMAAVPMAVPLSYNVTLRHGSGLAAHTRGSTGIILCPDRLETILYNGGSRVDFSVAGILHQP